MFDSYYINLLFPYHSCILVLCNKEKLLANINLIEIIYPLFKMEPGYRDKKEEKQMKEFMGMLADIKDQILNKNIYAHLEIPFNDENDSSVLHTFKGDMSIKLFVKSNDKEDTQVVGEINGDKIFLDVSIIQDMLHFKPNIKTYKSRVF